MKCLCMMLVGRETKALLCSMFVFGIEGAAADVVTNYSQQGCHNILAVCQYSHQYSYQPYMYLLFLIKMWMKGQE